MLFFISLWFLMPKKMQLWKSGKNNTLQCLVCNHYCVIAEWQTWICWIRKNAEKKIELLVYGKALWMNVDPIEKKPLYHFFPWSQIFSFWTAWCNFRCDFCQNRQMSQAKAFPEIINLGEALSPKDIIEYCVGNKIESIAYTYNEPTVFVEYALDTMKLAHKKNIKNVRVSNGFMSTECLEQIAPYLDAINVDLKSFSDEFYKKICWARLQPILDNIKRLYDHKIRQEITTLVIPWYNDDESELKKIAEFIFNISPDIPRHISAFYGMYKMKDVKSTPLETLNKAYEIGKQAGLNYVYIGNIFHNGHENTYCPTCQELCIAREWFDINNKLIEWKCPKCTTKIAGRRKK